MLVAVMNCCSKEELEEESSSEEEERLPEPDPERRKIIKNKIMVMGKLSRVFSLLRYVPDTVFPSWSVLFIARFQ